MRKATKAANSPYYKARMKAAECNDILSSREGAAEITGIERTRLARIELGSLVPYPEEVQLMADTYNAPELMNYHCTADCPIGKQMLIKADKDSIEQIALSAYVSLENAKVIQATIIEIAADGIIDDSEKPKIKEILKMLDEISKMATELKIVAKKIGVKEV